MATDAYVKFGKGTDTGGPNNTPLPAIEGDSTDAQHYWWCELRDCNFDITVEDRGSDSAGQTGDKSPNAQLTKVTMKKRVDWASAQLFMKCCEGHEATVKKTDADQNAGKIDQVTVEICKTVGEQKFPFIIVTYYGARILSYAIDVSSPEPAETITFEIEGMDYEFQPTDAFSGLPKGGLLRATDLKNHKPVNATASQAGGAVTVSSPAGGGLAASVSGASPPGVVGPPPGHAASAEAKVTAGYPGAEIGTGNGLMR